MPLQPISRAPQTNVARRRRTVQEREWGRRQREDMEEADKLDRSIAKRRWLYEHDIYAKVRLRLAFHIRVLGAEVSQARVHEVDMMSL